jgi:uncharacterized membrane protein
MCILLLAYIWGTASQLPDNVATHFDAHGTPNGWMTKRQHLIFTSAFGIGLPLFMVAAFSLIRVLPSGLVNIPNRDYWLAPERKMATSAWILRQGLWLASVIVCWIAALNFLLVRANEQQPPHLPAAPMLWLTVALLGYIVIFIVRMFRRFRV